MQNSCGIHMFDENGKRFLSAKNAGIIAVSLAIVGFGTGFLIGGRGFLADSSSRSIASESLGADKPPSGVDFSPVWKAWQAIDEKFLPAAVFHRPPPGPKSGGP